MNIVVENPVALLFLSFAFGAISNDLCSRYAFYDRFRNLNFLSDSLTHASGVLWIQWLILNTPLRLFNQKLKIEGRPTRAKLLELRKVMTGAEVGHWIAFVILLPFLAYYLLAGKSWVLILLLTGLNVLFNGYTALTQQYNKRRLDRLIDRRGYAAAQVD